MPDLGQSLPIDPSNTGGLVDDLGDFLLRAGRRPGQGRRRRVRLRAVLHGQADLTADELAALGLGGTARACRSISAGASLAVTVRVEKDLPTTWPG